MTGTGPDRITPARARVLEMASDGLAWTRSGLAHAAGVSSTVIDGLKAQGVFETVMIPPRPVVAAPDPSYGTAVLGPEQADGRRHPAQEHRGGQFRRHADRRRHRFGQDGGLFRGGRRGAGQGQAGADPAAGNRADARLPRALPGPLRRKAGRMAFRPAAAHARKGLAPGGGGRRAGGRRRALGAVPAVPRSRPDRRRRGARPRLQAGGPRLLQCPRHGGGARPHRRLSRWCWPRRRRRSRAGSMPSRAAMRASRCETRFADAALPDIAAIDMRRAPPARGGFLSPVLLRPYAPDAGARRAVAALPQPARLCAADALPGLRPPLPVPATARPGWSSTGFAASSSATIAATTRSGRKPARNAARSIISSPAGRASSASPRRSSRIFPTRAPSCCRPTFSAA